MHDRKSIPTREGGSVAMKAAILLGVTLVTVAICWLAPAPEAGGETGVVMKLPLHVGNLYSFPQDVSPAELYILPADTTYARYTYGPLGSPPLDRILCSIVLSGAERRSIHRPERCLPSQGWHIESSHVESIPLDSGRTLEVTALLLDRPANLQGGGTLTLHQYFLYWFVGKDVTTPYQFRRILTTNWDLLVHRVNQRWAYVIVSKNISKDWNPDGMDDAATLAQLKQFIHDSVPSFMKTEMPPKSASN